MIRSIRLQLTLWYIGSIGFLVLIFGGIVFFSFRIVLRNEVDRMLYNGGTIFREVLAEYWLKDEYEPGSLYTTSDEGDELLTDIIDEHTKEIFAIQEAYIQVHTMPKEKDRLPQLIAKTHTLDDRTLPFSSNAY